MQENLIKFWSALRRDLRGWGICKEGSSVTKWEWEVSACQAARACLLPASFIPEAKGGSPVCQTRYLEDWGGRRPGLGRRLWNQPRRPKDVIKWLRAVTGRWSNGVETLPTSESAKVGGKLCRGHLKEVASPRVRCWPISWECFCVTLYHGASLHSHSTSYMSDVAEIVMGQIGKLSRHAMNMLGSGWWLDIIMIMVMMNLIRAVYML